MPDRTLVMGVVNVTPDSFSDGGRWFDADAAIAHGLELVAAGADILDVGGESTRPGAARVAPEEELRRVVPVIGELAGRGIRVSVDTMRAATAQAAVEAGAEIINDVSAGLADAAMGSIAAETGARYVAMHWRGHSDRMDSLADYTDVAVEVRDELAQRVDALVAAGVAPEKLILDPGLGFAKRGDQNWELLGRLDVLAGLGLPILVGASRKRFLGAMLPETASVTDRDLPTAVVSVLSAQAGAWAVRVHDVQGTRRALDVLGAWQSGRRD
ncbi:dihydropteroate synthase [Agromyces cerinus]|uniref:dihydropteroate synthase n=1 Tax=Agromyces cerinus TaxID=33878 RepID=UPI0019561537|nr:dihydropteroate synthase [Agromyces cerinus]MBM7829487.1 dihydropteroate synthase [Agromyces cerinus]